MVTETRKAIDDRPSRFAVALREYFDEQPSILHAHLDDGWRRSWIAISGSERAQWREFARGILELIDHDDS